MINVPFKAYEAADYVESAWRTEQDYRVAIKRAAYQCGVSVEDVETVLDYRFTSWAASRGLDV